MEKENGKEGTEARPLRRLKLRERKGFQRPGMRALYRILYPFYHCREHLPAELRESGEPVVFVANHYNLFGPLSFVLSVPLNYRIWVNAEMMEGDAMERGARPTIKKFLPFLGERGTGWLLRKLKQLVHYALSHVGMISVDREDPSKLFSTMRQSMAALQEGDNLLIFPETGFPEYSLTSVTPFFSGFATLGRLYYRKTGIALRFCPCYIDEQHYVIRFGEPVVWDPEADPTQETERVSDLLNQRIREMAAENRGVEKETSTPVRRTILFFCNLIRFLLLIPLITMLSLPNPRMILLFYLISEGLRILFNAVCSTSYSATNRMSSLISHGIGIGTDIGMMAYLAAGLPPLRWLLYALILNGAVILASNIRAWFRYRRCAGVNYFDSLSGNLLFIISLQRLMDILPGGWFLGAINLAAMICLGLSALFAMAFNARIGLEEE